MKTSQVDITKALAIGGWMSERELTWLAVAALECKTIVEFGSFHGRSTRALADNSPDDCKIYAVDPWNGEYQTESGVILGDVDTYALPYFKRNLADHIATGRVIVSRGFSRSFKLDTQVDMLFIDGDHRYSVVYGDVMRGMLMVRKGGILSGHDYNHPLWPGVKQAIEDLNLKVEVEDTIWWTREF